MENQITRISVQNDTHMTAHEKKALVYMLNNNMESGATKMKTIKIEKTENNEANVIIGEKYKNANGEVMYRNHKYKIKYS